VLFELSLVGGERLGMSLRAFESSDISRGSILDDISLCSVCLGLFAVLRYIVLMGEEAIHL